MKRIAVGCVLALGLVLGSSAAATAGEYNGKGEYVPGGENGKSACSYSGRDVPDDLENNPPGGDDDFITGGHVQSYGQIVKDGGKTMVPSPGVACRGNATFHG